MSDAQYHEDEELYHDYMIRDANDEGPPDYEAEFLDPQQFDEALLAREAEEGYDVEKLKPRRLPYIGMSVCYHDDYHGKIVAVQEDGDVVLDNGQVVDFNHCCEPLPHSIEHGTAHPCPTCGEYLGFHNDAIHRRVWIDEKYQLEKGWHLVKS